MNKERDQHRRGMVLVMAVAMLFVLSSFVTYAVVTVRSAYKLEDMASNNSKIRRACQAGIARGRTKLLSSGPMPINLKGVLDNVPFQISGNNLGQQRYELQISATTGTGRIQECRVIVQFETDSAPFAHRILEYSESTSPRQKPSHRQ